MIWYWREKGWRGEAVKTGLVAEYGSNLGATPKMKSRRRKKKKMSKKRLVSIAALAISPAFVSTGMAQPLGRKEK